MVNKYIISILASAIAITGLTGCDDYLDTINENVYPAHETLTSIADLEETTAYLYAAPWYYFHKQRWVQLGDSRANNIYTGSTTNDFALLGSFGEQNNNTALSHGWGSLYNVVTQADYILEDYIPYCKTQGIGTEAELNRCEGEARFMRSLAYWYLAMFWHDVPIIDNPVTADPNARANRFEDVLQYAICDAEYAAKWLPATPIATGRVSKPSAEALLSRLYLTAAAWAKGGHYSETFVSKVLEPYYSSSIQWNSATSLENFFYKKAADAATQCINNAAGAGYGLMEDYEQIFRVQNNNCKESLFALQFVGGATSYGICNDQQGSYCYDRCLNNNYGQGYIRASYDFVYCSIKRDGLSRSRGNFMASYMPYDYLYHELDTCGQKGEPWVCANMSSLPIKKQVVGGPIATDNLAIKENSGFCTPMIRMSEVYLNQTEALMGAAGVSETSSSQILEGVNIVRRRAHRMEIAANRYRGDYGTNGHSFNLDSLMVERRLEFFCESLSWPDIVRRSFMGETHLNRMIAYNNNELIAAEGDSIMGCHRLNSYRYTGIKDDTSRLGVIKLSTNSDGSAAVNRPSRKCIHNVPDGSWCHAGGIGEGDNLWSMVYPPAESLQSPNLLLEPVSYDFSEIINNRKLYHD